MWPGRAPNTSSAYATSSLLSVRITSRNPSRKTFQRNGPEQEPCGQPFEKWYFSGGFIQSTRADLLCKNELKIFIYCVFIFRILKCLSSFSKGGCQTLLWSRQIWLLRNFISVVETLLSTELVLELFLWIYFQRIHVVCLTKVWHCPGRVSFFYVGPEQRTLLLPTIWGSFQRMVQSIHHNFDRPRRRWLSPLVPPRGIIWWGFKRHCTHDGFFMHQVPLAYMATISEMPGIPKYININT